MPFPTLSFTFRLLLRRRTKPGNGWLAGAQRCKRVVAQPGLDRQPGDIRWVALKVKVNHPTNADLPPVKYIGDNVAQLRWIKWMILRYAFGRVVHHIHSVDWTKIFAVNSRTKRASRVTKIMSNQSCKDATTSSDTSTHSSHVRK